MHIIAYELGGSEKKVGRSDKVVRKIVGTLGEDSNQKFEIELIQDEIIASGLT